MFNINIDDESWTFWFKPAKFNHHDKFVLVLCRGGIDWESSEMVLQASVDRSHIHWSNSIIMKNRTTEDGMWIPDELKDYIIECHKRYFNLLVFS